MIIILYLCICFLYKEFIKLIDDIEDHIIKNEMRFDNELMNQWCYMQELNKGIQCKTEDINVLEDRIEKLERKVKKC